MTSWPRSSTGWRDIQHGGIAWGLTLVIHFVLNFRTKTSVRKFEELLFAFNFWCKVLWIPKSQSDIPMIKNIVSPVFPIILFEGFPIIDGNIKCQGALLTPMQGANRSWNGGDFGYSTIFYPIGSMVLLYMVTFTINIPQMLAYIPYMDPMGIENSNLDRRFTNIRWCFSMVFFCKRLPEGSQTGFFMDIWWDWQSSSGWWFQPLWKILVKWDYCSQYMEKIKNVWNHQPVMVQVL